MKLRGFIDNCRTFIRGLKILIGIRPYGRGDKKLAIISATVRGYIPIAGVPVVRKQIINEIQSHLRGEVKKNPSVTADELLANALGTPDYMNLLKDLDMGERDLRFFASEALKTRRKNDKRNKRK